MGVEMDPRPKIVAQGAGPKCWAAATESWLSVNLDRMQLDMATLITRYGNAQKGGSITFKDEKWYKLMDDFRWSNSLILQPTAKTGKQFFRIVESRLAKLGYLIAIISQGGGSPEERVSHAMVVFGIRTLPNKGAVLMVMDPAKGDYDFFRIDGLFGQSIVFMHTKEDLSPVRKPFPTFQGIPDGPPINP
jgi:hypothetical protein